MPTYNGPAVADGVIAFRKPITLQQGRALRDNPLAIAEGATGAPKVVGKALDIDAGNLVGTAALVDLDDAAKILLVASAVGVGGVGSAVASIGYQVSSDNGATWGAAVTIANSTILGSGGGTPIAACASGARIIDMTGFNAVRLNGSGTLSGSVIWVEGV